MRFLDQFSVLLLDMNGTFMFGHDRFGPDQDYFATYQRVGGRSLDRESVLRIVKPSRLLFERALAGVPPNSTVLFVGDSLERDIIPAKTLGLSTAWIAPLGSADPAADVVVGSLSELAEIASSARPR